MWPRGSCTEQKRLLSLQRGQPRANPRANPCATPRAATAELRLLHPVSALSIDIDNPFKHGDEPNCSLSISNVPHPDEGKGHDSERCRRFGFSGIFCLSTDESCKLKKTEWSNRESAGDETTGKRRSPSNDEYQLVLGATPQVHLGNFVLWFRRSEVCKILWRGHGYRIASGSSVCVLSGFNSMASEAGGLGNQVCSLFGAEVSSGSVDDCHVEVALNIQKQTNKQTNRLHHE